MQKKWREIDCKLMKGVELKRPTFIASVADI